MTMVRRKDGSWSHMVMKSPEISVNRKCVYDWFKRFRNGMETTENEPRSGRPPTSRTPDMIEWVRQMMAHDRRVTLWLMAEELGISKETGHTIVCKIWVSRRSVPSLCRTSWQRNSKQNGWKFLKISLPCVTRIHPFCQPSLQGMRPGATSSIRNPSGNRWNGVHRLPRDPNRVACKSPRSRKCWSPSLTAMASSIRNLFLRVKPWIPRSTRKLWNDCYDASTVFGQSCTEVDSGCCCMITRLRTVRSVSTNSWLSVAYPFLIIHRTPPIWHLLICLFPRLKSIMKGARFADMAEIQEWVTGSTIDSYRGLCWQFPEALWMLPKVCCEGWWLFWRPIKLICL